MHAYLHLTRNCNWSLYPLFQKTSSIHGILGQTYRADHSERANEFTKLSALLKAPIIADGVTGKGFLDGEPLKDCLTTGVLAPDCAFSSYIMATGVADNAVTVQ